MKINDFSCLDLLGRMLRNNTSLSHPVTTKGSPRRRDLSCEKETSSGHFNHIHLLEYEEFTPEKDGSVKNGDFTENIEALDLPTNKEKVIKLNEITQQTGIYYLYVTVIYLVYFLEKGKIARHCIKERGRENSDVNCKVLTDSSTKEPEALLSERNNKSKGLIECKNNKCYC